MTCPSGPSPRLHTNMAPRCVNSRGRGQHLSERCDMQDSTTFGLRSYRRRFIETHGAGPHACCFCGEDVVLLDGGLRAGRTQLIVHHVDGDRWNNALDNLAACHLSCHTTHHHTGRTHLPEHRQKIGNSLVGNTNARGNRGRRLSPEHCAKISERTKGNKANLGRKFSPEHRARISAALRAYRAQQREAAA